MTGYGVYVGMKAAAKERWGSDCLAGKTVAVQGAGNVAYHLCRHLHAEGVRLIVTDIDADKVKRVVEEFGAGAVAPEAIYDQAADIFAPCALGATINDETLPRLKVEIIAGGANNQLAEDRHGDELEQREHPLRAGLRDQRRRGHQRLRRAAPLAGGALAKKAGEIYDTLLRIFEIARAERIPTYRAADRLAEQRIAAVAGLDRMWIGRAAVAGPAPASLLRQRILIH